MVMALNKRELSTNMLSQHSILKVNNICMHKIIFIVAIPQEKLTNNQSINDHDEKHRNWVDFNEHLQI